MGKLNQKQQAFVEHYVDTMDPVEAIRLAGYNMTDRAASVHASRLLKNANVQKALRDAREARRKGYTVTAAWVLEQIAQIAQNEEETARDRLKALELLGKHLGIWERPESGDSQGVRVVFAQEAAEWSE